MYAAESGSVELVVYLLNKGADYRIKDNENENALQKAKNSESHDIIDVIEYKKAEAENSMTSYSGYIKNHKRGRYINEAKISLERAEYDFTMSENTIEQYGDFLEKYPKNEYKDKLELQLANLRYQKTCEINTIESYLEYRKLYPKSTHSEEISQRLETLLSKLKSIHEDTNLLGEEIDKTIYPLTLTQLYVDCSSLQEKDKNTLSSSNAKSSGKGDIEWSSNILGEQFKMRAVLLDQDKNWSMYASSNVGNYIKVALVKGEVSLLDIYQGSDALTNRVVLLELAYPEKDSSRAIPFNKITFYDKNENPIKTIIHNDGNFMRITHSEKL